MNTEIEVSSNTSVKSTVVPFIEPLLKSLGYAIVRMQDISGKLETDALILATLIGQSLSQHDIAYHLLESDGSDAKLATHTEGVSKSTGIIPFFALCCLRTAEVGGQTRLFDGRKAATLLSSRFPAITDVSIEYTSELSSEEKAMHSLVLEDKSFGKVLRYRSRVATNKVLRLPEGMSEDDMYAAADLALSKSVLLSHEWKRGDVLFVNNNITLHDRLPFQGKRIMLRIRFGDHQHRRIQY